jgi:ribosomal-protein-alanine N-acetyltransferase
MTDREIGGVSASARAPHRAAMITRIRTMTEADLGDVLAIERASFSSPWTEAMFLAELRENPFARFLVAMLDDAIIGYVGGWVIVDELHLLTLAVFPEYRRLGVARRLLERLFESGDSRIAKAGLEVRRSNRAAIAVYERFGFRSVGVRRGYYADPPEDAIVMEWASAPMARAGRPD